MKKVVNESLKSHQNKLISWKVFQCYLYLKEIFLLQSKKLDITPKDDE